VRLTIVALLVVLVAAIAIAQKPQPQPPNAIAHGSEKVGAEAAHPGENLGGPHEGPKFLGLPSWIWKLANMIAFIAFLGWLIGGPVKRALAWITVAPSPSKRAVESLGAIVAITSWT